MKLGVGMEAGRGSAVLMVIGGGDLRVGGL